MVVDFEAEHYKRLIFNADEYDISTVGVYSVPNATAPHISVNLRLATTDGSDGAVEGIDDVVLTQDEP